ncbi:MAG: lipoyl(octanoyl) transferase LipB [Gammaproteobacteria bacterium]
MQLLFRQLGQQDYQSTWRAMRQFTDARKKDTTDEVWIVEHPPVFTQGQAGKAEHILNPGDIPIVQTDRGGQVTYHGPGQLIAYLLIDIKRRKIGVRALVCAIEQSVIHLLSDYGINAYSQKKAPGVYVDQAKICALGLRIRRGCSYHGLALNVNLDLDPFSRINPCGYANLAVTQMRDLIDGITLAEVNQQLSKHLIHDLNFI